MSTADALPTREPRLVLDNSLMGQAGAGSMPLSIAPDGRMLAIKEDDSVRSDHIVVVQNWRR